METQQAEMNAEITSLRFKVDSLTKEKIEQQTKYIRRIEFLERQIDVMRRGKSSFHRRRSSSMSSEDCGSGDWTHKAEVFIRPARSVVSERDLYQQSTGPKRSWCEMWRTFFGKRSRESQVISKSTWQARMANGKIFFVDTARPKKPTKKRRGISGDSSWV